MELAVVMLILGVFSTFLMVRVEGLFTGGDLRLASRIIIGEISRFRGKAAYTHQEQVLGLEVGGKGLYPVESAPESESSPAWATAEEKKALAATYLPKGVIFEDVVLLKSGKVQEGEARIRFFGNGCVEQSLIHLRNEAERAYTLEINPLTGFVKVFDSYVDQEIME